MRTVLIAALLCLVPFIGHAQDTLPDLMADHAYFGPAWYKNTTDSAEFSRFRKGLRTVRPAGTKDTTQVRYRMVWREDQHGGLWSVSRGDSSVWQAREYGSLDLSKGAPSSPQRAGVVCWWCMISRAA